MLAGSVFASHNSNTALADQAQARLLRSVNEEKAFIQVHAADALAAVGDPEPVRAVFSKFVPADPADPRRVGIWRSLAGSARTPQERAIWTAKIEEEFMNPASNLRVGALESVGKLGHVLKGPALQSAQALAKTFSEYDAAFVWWPLHLAGDRDALTHLIKALDSSDQGTRSRASYAMRYMQIKDPAALKKIAEAAEAEAAAKGSKLRMRAVAVALNADPAHTAEWQALLERELVSGSEGAKYDAALSLMYRYTPADLYRLEPLLKIPSGDAPIGGAWAILYVLKHSPKAK